MTLSCGAEPLTVASRHVAGMEPPLKGARRCAQRGGVITTSGTTASAHVLSAAARAAAADDADGEGFHDLKTKDDCVDLKS